MLSVPQPVGEIPLVVDLDGTLTKVDTLHEAVVQLAARQPVQALRSLAALRGGLAAFKRAVADHVLPDSTSLPLNEAVLAHIGDARAAGRKVYLASASDARVAEQIAHATGLFDGVFASQDGNNLKGQTKANRLVETFGHRGFDYIGNGHVDLPVWRAARLPIVAGASRSLFSELSRERPDAILLDTRKINVRAYLRELRPHQWLKNILVALPALAGHQFDQGTLVTILTAFVSFSFGASAIYVVNDMIDLPHDRAHSEKRTRPLAAATVPILHGILLSGALGLLSLAAALTLPWAFLLSLLVYFGLSISYSFYLKRKLMIDVVALAALYGIRVAAGGAATAVPISDWLIGFCFFIFLSLALMKRTTEIMLLTDGHDERIKGRGYRRQDLPIINSLTVASGFVAILILALYINSPEVKRLYQHPQLLWGICMVLVYWLGRAFFLTGRGEMQQDPVVFAATDRISMLAGMVVLGLFFVAL